MALASRNSGCRASELLTLYRWAPETLCLDFDLCCATRLLFYDAAKEERLAAMLGMGQINKAMGVAPKEANVERW